MKFDGITLSMSEDAITENISATEANYYDTGPPLERMVSILAAEKYELKLDPAFIETRIRALKNIDGFSTDRQGFCLFP
jgi:hypothetical protein